MNIFIPQNRNINSHYQNTNGIYYYIILYYIILYYIILYYIILYYIILYYIILYSVVFEIQIHNT